MFSRYWNSAATQNTGCTNSCYQNFSRMVNNETKSIRYENIETLCLLLECTPNELFLMTEE